MKGHMHPETFEVVTVYDEAAYAALVRLMMKKLRRWPRYLLMGTGILSIAGAGYAILIQNVISAPALLFLLLGNLMCVFGIFADKFAVRMMLASNKKGTVVENHYLFDEEGLEIRSGDSVKRYAFKDMTRVFETGEYLFFFFSDGQICLMRRLDAGGDYDALRAFIDRKLAAIRHKESARG